MTSVTMLGAHNQAVTVSWTSAQRLRVLVVDDSAMSREITQSFLAAAGHKVDCAEGGTEATAAAADTTYDAILMDVQMPEMDGLEATRRIRSLASPRGRVPIVAMTAYDLVEQIEACRRAGMNKHLTKPFTQDMLLATLGDAIADGKIGNDVDVSPDMQLFDAATIEHITPFFSPKRRFFLIFRRSNGTACLSCAHWKNSTLPSRPSNWRTNLRGVLVCLASTAFQPWPGGLSMQSRRTRQTRPSTRIACASSLRTRYPKFGGFDCMRVILRSSSRNSSGAQTIVFWIICRATRRAATAVLRQALSTRRDSIMPLRLLGVTVRLPANAAWAAFCASRSSFFRAYDDPACPAS